MNYYDMNKCLCKELCCEFEKFEKDPNVEYMHNIRELVETMVGLTELEAAGAMRDYLEDEHGYDSRLGEFRNRDWTRPSRVWNAVGQYYPMTTPPYYGGDYSMMNDGRSMTRGDGIDMRRDGNMNNRGQSRDSRGRYNDGRDGYGVYNMAHMDDMKKKEKLTPQEIKKWMDNLESENGERGPMWSKEEIEAVAKKDGIKFDEFTPEELWAATNIMYSDYCSTGEAFNVDKPSFYISLAKNFLVDPDAVGEGGEKKLAAYYEYVVEH